MERLWASLFESFFVQFLGRLWEPSQTASDQVLDPFGFHFGSMFGVILGPKSKKGEKVKIELSLKREFNFQGLGTLFGKGPGASLGGVFGSLGSILTSFGKAIPLPGGAVLGHAF